jgi:hypothetical protein
MLFFSLSFFLSYNFYERRDEPLFTFISTGNDYKSIFQTARELP